MEAEYAATHDRDRHRSGTDGLRWGDAYDQYGDTKPWLWVDYRQAAQIVSMSEPARPSSELSGALMH